MPSEKILSRPSMKSFANSHNYEADEYFAHSQSIGRIISAGIMKGLSEVEIGKMVDFYVKKASARSY